MVQGVNPPLASATISQMSASGNPFRCFPQKESSLLVDYFQVDTHDGRCNLSTFEFIRLGVQINWLTELPNQLKKGVTPPLASATISLMSASAGSIVSADGIAFDLISKHL